MSRDETGYLKTFADSVTAGVGTITVGGATKALTPREACNKFLHATHVAWLFQESDDNPIYRAYHARIGVAPAGPFKEPKAVLRGTHLGKEWEALVSMPLLVTLAANFDSPEWLLA